VLRLIKYQFIKGFEARKLGIPFDPEKLGIPSNLDELELHFDREELNMPFDLNKLMDFLDDIAKKEGFWKFLADQFTGPSPTDPNGQTPERLIQAIKGKNKIAVPEADTPLESLNKWLEDRNVC
jgi:hypothetical protein